MNDQTLYKSAKNFESAQEPDGRRKSSKWPFAMMEIGDKITVEDAAQHDNATCSYKYAAKKYGMAFVRKTVDGKLWIKRIS